MGNNVFANDREISCKAADGKSICAFPDVCFTPPQTPATPPGVPIPYPNTGMASDCTSGSKNVKISGKEVMLKNKSYFKKSMGDEAGCAPKKGVITSKNMGKVYFNSWSMDVKFEGENVVRHLDLTTHNHASQSGQTPPQGHVDSSSISTVGCEGLDDKATNAESTLTQSKKTTRKTKKTKSVTSAASTFECKNKQLGFAFPSSSAVSTSDIKRGKRYQNFASGTKNESNVTTCDGNKFIYEESDTAPYQGHAEAKIIEDIFKWHAHTNTGRPSGTLFIKIKHTIKENWSPCPECQRLIDSVNKNSKGEPCDDFQIIICK